MRIFFLCLLLVPGMLAAQVKTANKLNLSFKRQPLSTVLQSITDQTGLVFSFDPSEVDTKQQVSVQLQAATHAEALEQVLTQNNLKYNIHGKFVILHRAKPEQKAEPEVMEEEKRLMPMVKNSKVVDSTYSQTLVHEQYALQSIEPLSFFLLPSSGNTALACHSIVTNKEMSMQTKQKVSNKEGGRMTKLRTQMALLLASLGILQATAQTGDATTGKSKQERTAFCVEAQSNRPAQLTFINPLGTDWVNTMNNSYALSINMLGGVNAGVTGAEFGGLYNINRGTMSGAQFAGLFNHNTCSVSGVQFGGLYNYARKGKPAFQSAGIYNHSEQGAQVQLAGIANMASQGTANVQVSGILNTADSSKTQIATVNILQRGGFQLGVVNIRDTADGVSLGLVNIVKKGGLMEVELAGGGAQLLNGVISLRTGSDRLYGILSFGHSFGSTKLWAYGAGLGTSLKLHNDWGLNIEGASFQLYDEKFHSNHTNILAQLRPLLSYRLTSKLSLFAGPSLNIFISSSTAENPLRSIAPYTILNSTGSNTNVQGWIGGTGGLRVRF